MRAPNSAWDTALDTLAEKACVLVEFQVAGSTVHRYALHDADVTFGGQTYTAHTGVFSQRMAKTAVPQAALVLDNTDKGWNTAFAARDYHQAKVIVRLVSRDALGTATAVLTDYWWVQRWQIETRAVAFKMSLQLGLLSTLLPRRTYADYCPWVFKDARCSYSGTDTQCSKRLEGKHGCREHFGASATKRYGGFPNRPSRLVVGVR